MTQDPFILGTSYKRTFIHEQYGGSRQSGIAPSATYPFIFIFSGDTGHQHGYKDQWENKDIFSYTGEGQKNDMAFVRGNLAIRNQIVNKKRVFLFISVRKGWVRFAGELEYFDYDSFKGKDRDGKDRTAIKFFFRRKGIHLNYPIEQFSLFPVEDPILTGDNLPNITERSGLVTSRVGQGAYRKSILFRWEFKCAVTNYSQNQILIASHIVPWSTASDDERLDVDNGILLSPTYDALFDKHLIGFENSGKIILSDSLLKTNFEEIGISGKEVIKTLRDSNYSYLARHRELLV